jgi:hypothetical protein
MRETVESLRRYFMLVGTLGSLYTLLGLLPILGALQNPLLTGLSWILVGTFGLCGLVQVSVGVAYVIFARNLERTLRVREGLVAITIMASMAIAVLAFSIQLYLAVPLANSVLPFVVGMAINYYLLVQVRRLAREAREKDDTPLPVA